MYIAIEGIDTAGKSTQLEALKHAFPDAVFTKEPGGTPIGSQIRDIVLTGDIKSPSAELLLFLADRAEHLAEVIKPNLRKLIISDRSVVSGIAYADVKTEYSIAELVSLNRFATEKVMPDIVFILKLTPEVLQERLSQKELDGIESRGVDYLLSIQNELIDAAEALQLRYHLLDAAAPIETITNEIISTIKESL
ncbi:MAG: dTMP kinase [Campylobacterota bacterium]|nr:dTMP kinase [Campylobacterota bacterium]